MLLGVPRTPLTTNVGKYCIVGQATDDIIMRMRAAWWVTKATNTHSEYVVLIVLFYGKNGYDNAPQYYLISTCILRVFLFGALSLIP